MIQDKANTALIKLWGIEVGAVTWLEEGYAVFEYTDAIKHSALNVSPIRMPFYKPDTALFSNNRTVSPYMFPELNPLSFKGLPGLLVESLLGEFSTSMLDEYRARKGCLHDDDHEQMSPVDMLCALGKRGMGALEFTHTSNRINSFTRDDNIDLATPVKIEELVASLKSVIQDRGQMQLSLSDEDDTANEQAFIDLLRVTTSAGGTQAKAIIAINEATGEMLSGQGEVPNDFDYWLLKFDDIDDLKSAASKPAGSKQSTRIEYAYALMARAAKINISECRLLEENDRAHFITRRFDRRQNRYRDIGDDRNTSVKLHMQSLFALAHYDFKQPGVYSYEQAFEIMRQLHLSKSASLELYRLMLFNVFAYNLNDHTKNIAFLMDETGQWKLAPAFNLTCSHKSDGKHDYQHQMSINGKCDNFMREDLMAVGQNLSLPKVERIIDEVKQAVLQWPTFAKRAGLKKKIINSIAKMHRLDI